jgi:acetyl esterase/lipase
MLFRRFALQALILAFGISSLGKIHAQEIFKDVPFDVEAHTLDIYRANPAGPTVFYIPGGNWYKHDKNLYTKLGVALAGYGINLIIPQYGQEQKYPDNLIDVVEAVRWSQANLPNYGFSSTQFHLVGHSAGAHLAYMSLTDGRSSLNERDFQSLTLISGLYDINFLVRYGNRWKNWAPLQGWHASPIHTKRLIGLPLTVVWAENDYDVVKRQTKHFLHANEKICQPLRSFVIPCDDHVTELLNAETNGLLRIITDSALSTATGGVLNPSVTLETIAPMEVAPVPAIQETPAPAQIPAPPAPIAESPVTPDPKAPLELAPSVKVAAPATVSPVSPPTPPAAPPAPVAKP